MPVFEILPGLPPYGPMAKLFSPDGRGAHREGLVVRFPEAKGGEWVGNFHSNTYGASTAVTHPNGKHVLVVAQGLGHVIDVDSREVIEYLDDPIKEVIPIPEVNGVLLVGDTDMKLLAEEGIRWRCGDAMHEGIDLIGIEDGIITGKAWEPITRWFTFTVSLQTGEVLSDGSKRNPDGRIMKFVKPVLSKMK